MEGKGVHVCAEGSRYEGQFRANYRDGLGRCQWGNRHDTPFRQGFLYLSACCTVLVVFPFFFAFVCQPPAD